MSVEQNETKVNENGTQAKDKKGNEQNTGENFDPPDGGWGWIIVVAAGFSNVSAKNFYLTLSSIYI